MNVVVMVMLMILANLLFMAVISDTTQSINTQGMINARTQAIREEAELEPVLKSELMLLMAQHGLNSLDLEKGLTQVFNGGTAAADISLRSSTAANAAAGYLTQWRDIPVGDHEVRVRVVGSSSPRDPVSYIEYETCRDPEANDSTGARRQKLRLRTSLKGGFSNAVTGQSMNCVFCHAHIYGNVGEYGDHSSDSLHNTRVYGSWFTAGTQAPYIRDTTPPMAQFTRRPLGDMLNPALNPNTRPKAIDPHNVLNALPAGTLNYGAFTLPKTTGAYDGPELPWNPQSKRRSLPKFDPRSMRILAKGTITGGSIRTVPLGGTYPGAPSTVNRVVEGNLILDGRTSPLVIQGRIYATGDVIIMGNYRGQGTIYAGRNIYVPQNLRAMNQAPVFNKSESSNLVMAHVSDPAHTGTISNSIWNYDRLMLVATNNVVIGNPFPFNATTKVVNGLTYYDPEIAADIRYITRVVIDNFDGEMYYEKKTGHMATVSLVNGKSCLTLPWEDTSRHCVETDAAGEFTSNSRFVRTPTFDRTPLQDMDKYKMKQAIYVPEAYWKNIFPMNVTDGTTGQLSPWITQSQFEALTINVADRNYALTRDACDRSRRSLFQEIPYGSKPLHLTSVNLAQDRLDRRWIKDRLNEVTGIFTKASAYKVRYREIGFAGSGEEYNAAEIMERYIAMCVENVARGIPPSFPTRPAVSLADAAGPGDWQPQMAACNAGVSGTTPTLDANNEPAVTSADQRYDAANFPAMPTAPMNQFTCQIDFFADDSTCSAGQKYAFVNVTVYDYPGSIATGGPMKYICNGGTLPSYGRPNQCFRTLERRPLMACSPCATGPACSCGCAPTSKALYFWRDANVPAHPNMPTMPDFRITIMPSRSDDPSLDKLPSIRVLTRLWEHAYDGMVDNQIRTIDAFLFANQFVTQAANTIHDRQIQINGGVSAKELAGRFANRVGHDRPAAAPSYKTSGIMENEDIGIVVMLDPRFQHMEDLIQEDFGRLELRETMSGGGAATCR